MDDDDSVVLAKVDVSIDIEIKKLYEIEQFPTIYYFAGGRILNFTGERTERGIISWCEKQLLPPVVDIRTTQELSALINDGVSSAVLFSSSEDMLKEFRRLAESDNLNSK